MPPPPPPHTHTPRRARTPCRAVHLPSDAPAAGSLLAALAPKVLRLYASRTETCASANTQLMYNLALDLTGSSQLEVCVLGEGERRLR